MVVVVGREIETKNIILMIDRTPTPTHIKRRGSIELHLGGGGGEGHQSQCCKAKRRVHFVVIQSRGTRPEIH